MSHVVRFAQTREPNEAEREFFVRVAEVCAEHGAYCQWGFAPHGTIGCIDGTPYQISRRAPPFCFQLACGIGASTSGSGTWGYGYSVEVVAGDGKTLNEVSVALENAGLAFASLDDVRV